MRRMSNFSWRALFATCLLTTAMSASAAQVAADSVITPAGGGFNGTHWYIGNTYCASGFGLADAWINDYSDAYDDAWVFSVDGVGVDAPTGMVDLTGSILTTPKVSRSGLNTYVQHYYSPTSSLARVMLVMQNPGNSARTVNVATAVNFGSDSGTVYRMTSSGDGVVSVDDRWIVSSDQGQWDPVNTSVMYGPGTPRVKPSTYTTSVHSCSGTQGIGASFTVTVPAGATRSLMFFAGLGGVTAADNTVASAVNAATRFNSVSTFASDWLDGLSNIDRDNVLNWNLQGFTSCAAEGYRGGQLTMCQKICESNLTGSALSGMIKLYVAAYREQPACGY